MAITQEKNRDISKLEGEIRNLKNDIKAKDVQINNLKLKEGELKGKDDHIHSLNQNI